jgi:predicted NUDIX family phosphoesterase
MTDSTTKECRTPDTMFHLHTDNNAISYVVVMPDDKVITEELSKKLEDALHNTVEDILSPLFEEAT